MRLLITSDLHYNHGRSTAATDQLIERMNRTGGDALLVIGDTAAFDGDALERCLSRFTIGGPKLFVAGNHELWTHRDDSHQLYTIDLPQRVSRLGWHWLEGRPFVRGDLGIVGSIGWYDYSFAPEGLKIPRRFYESKISPGAAALDPEFAHLLERRDDLPHAAMEIVARWNDGRFVKLHRPDEQFLEERLNQLETDLVSVQHLPQVLVGVHHLPFSQLLPPSHSGRWDFAKAYLGSDRIGRLLLKFSNVRHVFCGHSHFEAEARVGQIHAVNIGCGYRTKTFRRLEIDT